MLTLFLCVYLYIYMSEKIVNIFGSNVLHASGSTGLHFEHSPPWADPLV